MKSQRRVIVRMTVSAAVARVLDLECEHAKVRATKTFGFEVEIPPGVIVDSLVRKQFPQQVRAAEKVEAGAKAKLRAGHRRLQKSIDA